MRIAVCGLGRLGTPVAVAFAAAGVKVVGLDVDRGKVMSLNNWYSPVDEPGVNEILSFAEVKNLFSATVSVDDAVAASDACLFAVLTPSLPNGSFDNQYLIPAMASVARAIKRQGRKEYQFIINSTVTPGSCQREILPLLKSVSGHSHISLVYKPEFIALGNVVYDLRHPDFVLIGESDSEAGHNASLLYSRLISLNTPVKRMSLTEAELAKISVNCAITMKISFANQVNMVAKRFGANGHRILEAIGCDKRIGSKALIPGLPFGGPCFPRDNRMFEYTANSVDFEAKLCIATDAINNHVLSEVLRQALEQTGPVGILGQAYKPGTSVTDESPGCMWAKQLKYHGRTVKTHDVRAVHTSQLHEVLACPTVIVATAWPEYREIRLDKNTLIIDPMGVIQNPGQTKEMSA